MTFLKQLQSHRGGLIRLKSELYWYDRGSWDENPGQICLVLDASASLASIAAHAARAAGTAAAALLLIDDTPRWIWVSQADMEIL